LQSPAGPDDLRSSAIASLAEVCLGLQTSITPFTEPLFGLLLEACTDSKADIDVKTNAAFALGTLIDASEQDLAGQFGTVLSALHPLFEATGEDEQGARDNACGAVARMIFKNAAAVPLEQVSPAPSTVVNSADTVSPYRSFPSSSGLFRSSVISPRASPWYIRLRSGTGELVESLIALASQIAALISIIRSENPIALQHLDQIFAIFQQALASVAEAERIYPEVEGAQLEEETKQEVLQLLKDLNGSSAEKLAAAGLASYVV
jgi:importin-4